LKDVPWHDTMCWACNAVRNALGDIAGTYTAISTDDHLTMMVIGSALPAADQQRVVAAYRDIITRWFTSDWRPAITHVGFADYAPGEDHTRWWTIPPPTAVYALELTNTAVARR
jgi:hypothetical protein